jgi:hypothetical protein
VNGRKEELAAEQLQQRVAALPPLPGSAGEPRHVEAWAPSKRVRAMSSR